MLRRGTTSVEAADKEGWVVSITPSGGWNPACIAGHTGVGMSQRMQSFVLDSTINPFNVVEPGKRPRVTLTPTLAMKDGKPFMAFAVQGGDTQDQNLLQCFLDVVEFGMTIQEAVEAPNINTNQLWLSLGGTKIDDRKPSRVRSFFNQPLRIVKKNCGRWDTFSVLKTAPQVLSMRFILTGSMEVLGGVRIMGRIMG